MPDTFLFELFRVRCDLLEKAVAGWRQDPASIVRGDLDGALRECVNFPTTLRHLHNAVHDHLGIGPLPDLNATGLSYQALYDRILHILEAMPAVVQAFGDRGHLYVDASQLPAVTTEVARLKKEIFDPWPFFTQETLDEGRAEIARGEYVTIDEILNELQRSHQ